MNSNTYLAPPPTLGRSQCFGSTSTLNLNLPDQSENQNPKRRLLLVYIHGFMGSEASFNEFPAHVHQILSITLNESHEVYTKIYPRYRSRGDMSIARDDFSRWLSPHEAPDLDVVLLGHSLGGILASEVALCPSNAFATIRRSGSGLKHRTLGLVNFDVPFLGLHPGVITAGIGSLFRRKPYDASTASTPAAGDGLGWFGESQAGNGKFNPSFNNDIHLNMRKTGLRGAFHFLHKHGDNWSTGVPRHFASYYDHFGCLGDYSELKGRYQRLQELERDCGQGADSRGSLVGDRLRFINYYTASTGYFKKDKVKEKKAKSRGAWLYRKSHSDTQLARPEHTQEENLSTGPYLGDGQLGSYFSSASTHDIPSRPAEGDSDDSIMDGNETIQDQSLCTGCPQLNLPQDEDRSVTSAYSDEFDDRSRNDKPRDHKFCWVPKGPNGSIDPLWARVVMEDIDEVAAHQTLFLPRGPYYDELVGDTAAQIESWVQDDLTRRAILAEEKPF